MSQTMQATWMAIWQALPDPTDPAAPHGRKTQMFVPLEVWEHIWEKHIQPRREPWEDMIGQEGLEELFQEASGGFGQTAGRQKFLDALEREVRRSLERPLVAVYGVATEAPAGGPGPVRYQLWMLVLPSGATAYAHQKREKVVLVTCYFPKPYYVEKDRQKRWKKIVAGFVWRYCPLTADGHRLAYPSEEHFRKIARAEGKQVYHCRIRFVTWQSWGFSSDQPGSPWQGRLADWEAAEPTTQVPKRRRQLRRRPCRREEDE